MECINVSSVDESLLNKFFEMFNEIKEENVEINKSQRLTTNLLITISQKPSGTPIFVSIDEFKEMYGCSRPIAVEVFNRKDFPCSHFGKEKKAEVHALIDYFSTRHERI